MLGLAEGGACFLDTGEAEAGERVRDTRGENSNLLFTPFPESD